MESTEIKILNLYFAAVESTGGTSERYIFTHFYKYVSGSIIHMLRDGKNSIIVIIVT
jgi:hypothetical protein